MRDPMRCPRGRELFVERLVKEKDQGFVIEFASSPSCSPR